MDPKQIEEFKKLEGKENLPGAIPGLGVKMSPDTTVGSLSAMETGVNKQVEAGLTPGTTLDNGSVLNKVEGQDFNASSISGQYGKEFLAKELEGVTYDQLDSVSLENLKAAADKLGIKATEQATSLMNIFTSKTGLTEKQFWQMAVSKHKNFAAVFPANITQVEKIPGYYDNLANCLKDLTEITKDENKDKIFAEIDAKYPSTNMGAKKAGEEKDTYKDSNITQEMSMRIAKEFQNYLYSIQKTGDTWGWDSWNGEFRKNISNSLKNIGITVAGQ